MKRLLIGFISAALLVPVAPVYSMQKVTTANVKNFPQMPQKFVRSDVREVASKSDVVLWQEIGRPRYKRAVKNLQGYRTARIGTEIPISWRTSDWKFIQSRKRKIADGFPRLCRARWLTWVDLESRHTGKRVRFTNSHFVQGAFNPRVHYQKERRLNMWHKHFNTYKRMLTRWHEQGLTVLGGGDYNRKNMPKFVKWMRFIGHHSLDYLWRMGPWTRHFSTRTIKLHSDHDAVRAVVQFN